MKNTPYPLIRTLYALAMGGVGLLVLAWGLWTYPLPREQWGFTLLLIVLGVYFRHD